MRGSRRSGFTLVELVIGTTLMTLLGGAVMLVTNSTLKAYTTVTMSIHNDAMARRGMGKVKELLRGIGADQIDPQPGPGLWTDTVEFQQVIGHGDGAPVWAPLQRLALLDELSDAEDGVDNDGDGLVDEKRLVWVQDLGLPSERTFVVIRHVSPLLEGELANGEDDNGNGMVDEPGACFSFADGLATFRITTVAMKAGTVVRASYETNTRMLNVGD